MEVPEGLFLLLILQVLTRSTSGTLASSCDSCHDDATCLQTQERGDSFTRQAFSCVCKDGFVGDGLTCYDTKLCSDSSCCSRGYHWSPDSGCVDNDECFLPDSPCTPHQVCQNTPGSFECLEPSPRTRAGLSSQSVLFNCGHAACPGGTDCIGNNGSRCADPCEHYTVLNDDWRSTNNTWSQNPHCDRDISWQGWYRLFLGQNSAHIPERCVAENRCGTDAPMWITEPHPTQSDGVVNRRVCSVFGGNCCNFETHIIQVKLCPGNHYVYKLAKPSTCYLGYCAEVNKTAPAVVPTTPDQTSQYITDAPATTPEYFIPTEGPSDRPATTAAENSSGVEGQVRLANAENGFCSGRVEIFHNGQWGTVCDDAWDLFDAQVVCRQLGCGVARSALQNAAFGQGSGPIWLDNVSCSGSESSITHCKHAGFGIHNCGHNEDASVVCEFLSPPTEPTQLICGRDKLHVGLDMARLTSSGLNPFSGNLATLNCSSFRVRDGVVWYEVEARAGACGNTLRTNRTHAFYSNSLFIYPMNNASFTLPLSLPFSCAYPLDTNSSIDVAVRPFLELGGGISGFGTKARASMSLFQNSNYTEAYPAGLVTLPVGSPLYVGVSVEETDRSFAVVLEDCYATHSSNPHNPEKYPLIQNKCPADRRQVSVVESGSSLRARFSALFFLQQNEYRDLYLHCSLNLCDRRSSSCVPPCTRRTYRSLSNSDPLDTLTVGPIMWDKAPE